MKENLCYEGDNEAEGLPEPVVGEGSLLLVGEQNAVQGVDLGLPDGVTHAPQGSQHKHNYNMLLH